MISQCVDCKNLLQESKPIRCAFCGRVYEEVEGIIPCYPTNLGKLAKEEAEFHDRFDEHAIDVHQLDQPRNRLYHERLWKGLQAHVPQGARVLEVGMGSGFDALYGLSSFDLTALDISKKTLERAQTRLGREGKTYVAGDGAHVPFTNESFDGVFVVATWHHFEDPASSLAEWHRVLKHGGALVIGVEPNATYFRWIKTLRPLLCRLTHAHPHEGSHADAEMIGFSYTDLRTCFEKEQWHNLQIRPMWFLAGFFHYGLEFLFRALRLKSRLRIPWFLEKSIVYVDELFFLIPWMRYLGWHWIIMAQKSKE